MSTAEKQPAERRVIPGDTMAPGLLAKAMGVVPFPDDAPAFARLQKALFEGDAVQCAFLVMDENHITPYVYLDEARAIEAAKAIEGVIACVPIVAITPLSR